MHLFQQGDFTLNSGAKSAWKLECDALTDADWQTLAVMVRELVGPFANVFGVPRGGVKLATALFPYRTFQVTRPQLIVDDVLTSGGSLERAREDYWRNAGSRDLPVIGAVVFARGPLPSWVRAVFQMPESFWLRPQVET